MSETADTVRAFIDAINSGDVEAIATLMTEDHAFIDSLGNRVDGRATMTAGWRHYFSLFPDYRMRINAILAHDHEAMAHGVAMATLHQHGAPVSGGAWRIPSAWRAQVRKGKIAEWQVYADNKPVYDLM